MSTGPDNASLFALPVSLPRNCELLAATLWAASTAGAGLAGVTGSAGSDFVLILPIEGVVEVLCGLLAAFAISAALGPAGAANARTVVELAPNSMSITKNSAIARSF